MKRLTDYVHQAWQAVHSMSLDIGYLTAETAGTACNALFGSNTGIALEEIGTSLEGRPLAALTLGRGATTVTIKGNAHADEPVGAVTCVLLAQLLTNHPAWRPFLDRYRFCMIPTANPDGLNRNTGWLTTPFDLRTYLMHVYRDLPRDDVEFGYPQTREADNSMADGAGDVRPENEACARFYDTCAPIAAHLSLHSMAFAGGAWFLIAAEADPTPFEPALTFLTGACADEDLPLHDEDRGGQRGFSRLRPGFHSIPTVEGMQAFFRQSGNAELTRQFRLNSMQYALRHCGARFAAVSELPYVYDPALADMTPTDLSRIELEHRRMQAQTIVLDELANILEQVTPFVCNDDGQFGLDYYHAYLAYRRSGLQSLGWDLDRYVGKPASRRDVDEVELLQFRHRVFNMAAGLKILQGCRDAQVDQRRTAYMTAFNTRFDEMTDRFRFRTVPLETQVRMQLATILTGLLAVEVQE